MKTRLMHVRANVKKLETSIRWYEEVLGFTVAAYWPPETPNYAHFEHENGAMFALMEHEDTPSKGRFNFYVDDVDALWEQYKSKAEVLEELFSTKYGSRKFTIADPDGNELGFVQEEESSGIE
ncbi:VOC family protein [Thalassobacillus pellis]|uniref:VOC family protein n=1 Tax=Thalassobacillus pellis TaxID=748008 RepID=UPI00196108F9|nr:VOC family protein [Thalassobacillus pellis]MBM7553570.1 putative enzyme related to lactoylglutathione lyase [Thalassobacillus pellis]